ncbi:hypothetical protein [Spirulina sp. 06S082]|uniref:hypothetical protein n=1 Tax=Spirulina sp. 06S082 TaxID=3110248 RepID=UPI002B21315D|nr:hypothetical protein [Spirulina sp. 06S082]MEA5469843.1 hypothetical protein [Spirulina sp. 06S082]
MPKFKIKHLKFYCLPIITPGFFFGQIPIVAIAMNRLTSAFTKLNPTERVSVLTWGFWAIASLVGYIIYHPLNACSFFPAGSPTFFQPTFLILTGLLGIACTIAYHLSYSMLGDCRCLAVWLGRKPKTKRLNNNKELINTINF